MDDVSVTQEDAEIAEREADRIYLANSDVLCERDREIIARNLADVLARHRIASITALQEKLEAAREALTFIADLPDPGEKEERSATFYRIYAANLKQIAAKALGRQTVSDEALQWAEDWWNSEEGEEARKQMERTTLKNIDGEG